MKEISNKAAKVARAIDAGFGCMKFTRKGDGIHDGSEVIFESFPSIALPSGETAADDGTRRLDTLRIKVDEQFYEVGRDIGKTMAGNEFGRDMTDAYYDSPVYHALMRGALSYMGDAKIDVLALGLPMNHFVNKDRVAKLEEAYTGTVTLADGKSVEIKKVIVHPQPLGGFLSMGNKLAEINAVLQQYPDSGQNEIQSAAELMEKNILVVDPGAYTLDWLVINNGSAIEKVSGACSDAGRMRVCLQVAQVIGEEIGSPLGAGFMQEIDEALRLKKHFRYNGRSYDLGKPQYIEAIKRAARDPVAQMLQSLRGYDARLDMILVVGGAPEAVADAIRLARPNLPLYASTKNSMYANLAGFQDLAAGLAAS